MSNDSYLDPCRYCGKFCNSLENCEARRAAKMVGCREAFEGWIKPRLGGKELIMNNLGWYEDVAYVRVEDQWEIWKAAWKAAPCENLYEDVYEQCQELINPHIGSGGCIINKPETDEYSLVASVVDSLRWLIEFWVTNRSNHQPVGMLDAVEEPWESFYQLSYHSGLTTHDIFTFGFEAAWGLIPDSAQPDEYACRVCGTGDYLPSGKCDHCNTDRLYAEAAERYKASKSSYDEGAMDALDKTMQSCQKRESGDLNAVRYQRLRILGVAPSNSKHLDNGTVLCFTNLDEFVDYDLRNYPSRGEATAPNVDHGKIDKTAKAVAEWEIEERKKDKSTK